MKKTITFSIIIGLLVLLLAGCMSSKTVKEPKGPVVVGAEGEVQPDWVASPPKSATVHYESGYAKLSNKANSIKRANAEAKEKISQWIQTTVDSVVVNYTSDMGDSESRQALEAFESISRQTSKTSLMGVSQEGLWVDPEGGVWVLLSIPIENTLKAFETATKEFERNEAAMYAEFKMGEALKMLEDTLAGQ